MLLCVSALIIFCETPLNWTTRGYYRLIQFQLLYSFLHHMPWPVNRVENTKIPLWERSIFCNFQNASPRKCCDHFLRNSTQSKYSRILLYKVVEYQLVLSFLYHLAWPLYMVEKSKLLCLRVNLIFLDFPKKLERSRDLTAGVPRDLAPYVSREQRPFR